MAGQTGRDFDLIEYAGSLVGGRMVGEKMGKDGGKLVVLELAEMDFAGMDLVLL